MAKIATGIKASDIMTGEVVITQPGMTLVEAAQLMNKFRIGGLPVVENGRLVGAITERSIMKKAVETDRRPSEVQVKEIMDAPKVIVSEDTDINEIAKKMYDADVSRVWVCRDNKLVGIITNRDVLKHSHELIDILIEQAKIKGPKLHREYTAYGKCEGCGTHAHLKFEDSKFLCDNCLD